MRELNLKEALAFRSAARKIKNAAAVGMSNASSPFLLAPATTRKRVRLIEPLLPDTQYDVIRLISIDEG